MTSTDTDQNISMFKTILQRQVKQEVTKHINESIKPIVDSLVSEVAAEAVKNWAQHIRTEQDPYSKETIIQINFVENIVKTIAVENPISIEIKGK